MHNEELLNHAKVEICSMYRGQSLNDTLMDCVPETLEAEFISDKVTYLYAEKLINMNEKKQLIDFLTWVRSDNMESYSIEHLVE